MPVTILLPILLLPRAALAHAGETGSIWLQWGREPVSVVALALTGWLYARGVRRLWRGSRSGAGIKRWEAACFAGGWLALAVALVSPLHPLGAALFALHMTQHEILMLVAAPLMVLGRPLAAFLTAAPPRTAAAFGRWFNAPSWSLPRRLAANALAAWTLHAVVLWVWHIPWLFQATLRSELVHALQHASFFGSALLFWWAALEGGRAIGYGAGVLYMFTTAMHSGLLGAMITFARRVWYPSYELSAPRWGFTPLEDQQLGGLIMWIPAGLVYIVAGLALAAGWMRESERRVTRWQNRSIAGNSA